MSRILAPDSITADPFGERHSRTATLAMRLFGADFRFSSDHRELLRLVARTYGDLPRHRLTRIAPKIEVRLIRTAVDAQSRWTTPPRPRTAAGAGLLCGTIDAANYVALAPGTRAGLVAISPQLLRFPYFARYELLEFAVCTLAARVQNLVPLHAACVARRRRAILLMGDSGSGKTTLAAQCLVDGLDFLSEDSTFVSPDTALATGVANYIHVRPQTLAFLPAQQARIWRHHATTIRRRSGVAKLEVDLRRLGCRLAPTACRVAAIAFLTTRSAGKGPLLRRLRMREALARLERLQPYAAGQAAWTRFTKFASGLRICELRRGAHPAAAVPPLCELLDL